MTSTAAFNLPGVALITGAAGTGIGAAVAKAFAHCGCSRLAITDIKSLSSTRDALLKINPGIQILSREGDVSDESFVDSLMADVKSTFNRLDYAVNCAGILGPPQRSHETPPSAYDRVMDTNLKGTWLISRAALGIMIAQEPTDHAGQRGAIVNIASQLGIVGRPAAAPYCASKAAIINLTRSDAIDYSGDGIRINCVCPGVIETPMSAGMSSAEELKATVDVAPMKRIGKPSEVADAVLFLCSSQSSFGMFHCLPCAISLLGSIDDLAVQGHALVVDGGYTIH
ncbi:oxidoreductase [Astrocystis sublimbata]|nr:oxidoreductase [Astrocystis sublimbata]